MNLDIIVLYLIVAFFVLWLSIKALSSSEYFSGKIGTYQQYGNMVKLKQCIDQMTHRLKTIKAKKAEYKVGTWHYNYWTKKEVEHTNKLLFCRNQLATLNAQLTEGAKMAPDTSFLDSCRSNLQNISKNYNMCKEDVRRLGGNTYLFWPGKDSPGNDIKNLHGYANKIYALKNACDKDPYCQGFNTNAWLKKSILPSNQWYTWTADPNKGLYVKNTLVGRPSLGTLTSPVIVK